MERNTGKFPRQAVEAAVTRREEIIPELLRILDDTNARAEQLREDNSYFAHLYAMFLLAQFRETRAYVPAIRFASLPTDTLDSLGNDFLPTGLGRVLASLCGGDLAGIKSLIENESLDEWARGAGIEALLTLAAAGQTPRDEIVNYFASLFRGKLVREYSAVWDILVSCSGSLYPAELMNDIGQAYEDELVDAGFIGLEDVQDSLGLGKDAVLSDLAASPDYTLVEDAIAEMDWWACFHEKRDGKTAGTDLT